jgi:hypothetical protein
MITVAMSAAVIECSKLPRAMFLFYLHMGMGKINRMKDSDIFYVRDIFQYLLFWRIFYLVWM